MLLLALLCCSCHILIERSDTCGEISNFLGDGLKIPCEFFNGGTDAGQLVISRLLLTLHLVDLTDTKVFLFPIVLGFLLQNSNHIINHLENDTEVHSTFLGGLLCE